MVSKTTQFYRDNPLSRKKKNAYQKKYNKTPKGKLQSDCRLLIHFAVKCGVIDKPDKCEINEDCKGRKNRILC